MQLNRHTELLHTPPPQPSSPPVPFLPFSFSLLLRPPLVFRCHSRLALIYRSPFPRTLSGLCSLKYKSSVCTSSSQFLWFLLYRNMLIPLANALQFMTFSSPQTLAYYHARMNVHNIFYFYCIHSRPINRRSGERGDENEGNEVTRHTLRSYIICRNPRKFYFFYKLV